jgi:hypothetical protein
VPKPLRTMPFWLSVVLFGVQAGAVAVLVALMIGWGRQALSERGYRESAGRVPQTR